MMARAVAEGWTKLTVSVGAILKLLQFSERFCPTWVMVVVEPSSEIAPVPETTTPPAGAA